MQAFLMRLLGLESRITRLETRVAALELRVLAAENALKNTGGA